jgi:hydroxyacylglutathione hydrolase
MIEYQDDQVRVYTTPIFWTTSTVIQTRDLVLVVDPAYLPQEIEEIARFVSAARGGRKLILLFTHGDYDHILGATSFLAADTIGSLAMREKTDKEATLQQIRDFDRRYRVQRMGLLRYPELTCVIQYDGQQIVLGNTKLTFYLAPGHSADSLFTVIEPPGVFLAGDYLSDVEIPYVEDRADAYQRTMEKVASILQMHTIRLMIPGHGSVVTSQEAVLLRRHESLRYLHYLREAAQTGDEVASQLLLAEHSPLREVHRRNYEQMRRELLP